MFRLLFSVLCFLAINSCTDQRVKDRFNFDYAVPNEFEVVKKPELVMPGKFDLPKPVEKPQEQREEEA